MGTGLLTVCRPDEMVGTQGDRVWVVLDSEGVGVETVQIVRAGVV